MEGRGVDKQCRGLIALAKMRGMDRRFSMDLVELGLDERGPLRKAKEVSSRLQMVADNLKATTTTSPEMLEQGISAFGAGKLQAVATQQNLIVQASKSRNLQYVLHAEDDML